MVRIYNSGFSADDAAKVLGGNFVRIFGQALGAS